MVDTGQVYNHDDVDGAMTGNVCRCATYARIRSAIKQAAAQVNAELGLIDGRLADAIAEAAREAGLRF